MLAPHLTHAVLRLSELGSFQDAAKSLGVSRATFTRYIQRAESDIGVPLFVRSNQRVLATAAGRELLPALELLRVSMRTFEMSVERIRNDGEGELRIGAGPLTGRSIVEPILTELLQARPGLEIKIRISADIDVVDELLQRRLDVVIGDLTHTSRFEGLSVTPLRKQEMILVAAPGHEAHARSPCVLGDLLSYPFALPYLHKYWRQVFRAAASEADGSGRRLSVPQVECDDYSVLAGLARHAGFISGGRPENFEPHLASGALVPISLQRPIHWNICAIRPERWSFPALEAFWSLLLARYA